MLKETEAIVKEHTEGGVGTERRNRSGSETGGEDVRRRMILLIL